jgi:hypothetical protein
MRNTRRHGRLCCEAFAFRPTLRFARDRLALPIDDYAGRVDVAWTKTPPALNHLGAHGVGFE